MKRVIVLLLCISLLLPVCSINAATLSAERIVEELSEYTVEDRANMMAIALPMVLTDSGLDLAQDLINEFDPESDSTYNELLKPIFKIIDQETALNIVLQLYKIDESLRIKYLEGLQNREAAVLSPSSLTALNTFFAKEVAQVEGLGQICNEDGITAAVIARFCGLFVELNGNVALLTDTGRGMFTVNTVSPLLDEIALGMTADETSFTQILEQFVAELNARYSGAEKRQLKPALREIGLFAPTVTQEESGVNGGGTVGDKTETKVGGFDYKIIERSETDGDTIEIAYYENGKPVAGKTLTEPLKIAIPVSDANVMLYYEDADSTPVKYTAYADGMLHCRIDTLGTYKLYKVEPYFIDANDWGKDYIEALFRRGIISGKSAGVFAPEAQITREEFVKLAVELFGLTDTSLVCDFTDVAQDAWYAPYIASAKQHGIVNGVSAERFGVGAPITRQDMCKILYGMLLKMELAGEASTKELNFNDTDNIAAYAMQPVRALVELGIINGDDKGNFNPTSNATRQEAAKLIYGMLALYVR